MTDRVLLTSKAASLVAFLAAAYVAAQMMADIASLRLIEIAGWTTDGGTLIYPLTFTIRDLVHKVAGKRVARTLIFTAAGINVLMAGLFWLVANLPSTPDAGATTELFGQVLAPVWRIVAASIVAEVIAELIDTEVYSAWVSRFAKRHQWGRVLASNGVAIPVDSFLFAVLAFAGTVPLGIVWEIAFTNIVIKVAVTVLSIPLIYLVKPGRVVAAGAEEPIPA